MIPLQAEVRVWLATGHTDMRKGFDGLALLVQEKRKRDPHCGHLFVFRGRRGGLINRETRWGYVGIKTATFIDERRNRHLDLPRS
jgi:transposase